MAIIGTGEGHRVVGKSLARLVIASLEEAKNDETKSSEMTED